MFCLCLAVADLEDPRKLLDQAVADMQADMAKMRSASAQVGDLLACSIARYSILVALA